MVKQNTYAGMTRLILQGVFFVEVGANNKVGLCEKNIVTFDEDRFNHDCKLSMHPMSLWSIAMKVQQLRKTRMHAVESQGCVCLRHRSTLDMYGLVLVDCQSLAFMQTRAGVQLVVHPHAAYPPIVSPDRNASLW